MDLVLNPKVKGEIEQFLNKPSHALLLVGPVGSGKNTLATYISANILDLSEEKLKHYPHFLTLEPDGPSISIDDIRKLHSFVSLKTPGTKSIRRIVVVQNAQTLTIEAQNSFLKLLEEPPADTLFIMTASDTNSLLPTVLSRVRRLNVLPPDRVKFNDYLQNKGYKVSDIERALNVSGGLPGLATAILEADEEHLLVSQIERAKQLISSTMFERLNEVNNLAKNKDELPTLLMAIRRVSRAMLTQAAEKHSQAEVRKWHSILSNVVRSEDLLGKNPQPKLLLTNLLIQF